MEVRSASVSSRAALQLPSALRPNLHSSPHHRTVAFIEKYRPGERVTAKLTVRGEQQRSTILWSAVVYDIQGGTWVYEQTAPQTFVRRRVQVEFVRDGLAILGQGPPAGASIVTQAVVELFGTEFGFAK